MSRVSSKDFYTSSLSRFCDEQLPGDFHYLDGDEIILRYSAQPITYARATRVLRIIESKRRGEQIRRSQQDVFPILAAAIKLAVDNQILAKGSGVFILEGDEPYEDGAKLQQVLPVEGPRVAGMQTLGPRTLTRGDVMQFLRCRGLRSEAA